MNKNAFSVGYPGTFDNHSFPKHISNSADKVCTAEWNWSPGSDRREEYYLDRIDDRWLLWLSFFDDMSDVVVSSIVGQLQDSGHTEFDAAVELLVAFWKFDEHESSPGPPHEIEACFFLDEDLARIVERVWGKRI